MNIQEINGAWNLYYAPEKAGQPETYNPDLLNNWHKIPAQVPGNVEIDLEAGTVTGPNGVIQSNPLSESVLKTLEYGGLIPRVRAELGIE